MYACRCSSYITMAKHTEVLEWLKWYRLAVRDMISHKRVVAGSGYLGVLDNELYSAICADYYGLLIKSMNLLPSCFEAEERSVCEIPEVLHLVSGHNIFGIVYVVDKVPELSHTRFEKLASFISMASGMCWFLGDASMDMSSGSPEDVEIQETRVRHCNGHVSDVHKDLELHISGRIVATETRVPPKSHSDGNQTLESEDLIHVFISVNEDQANVREKYSNDSFSPSSVGSSVILGTIRGLGTSPEEGVLLCL